MACQCPKCGASCPEEATVCPDCGCSLEDRRKGSLKYIWYNPNKVFDKPMRWYQFLVNFGFVIFLFRDVRSCYTVFQYNLFDDHRYFRYSINPMLEILDWVDGFGFITSLVLGVIAWRKLEHFRRSGPLLYLVYRWLGFYLHHVSMIISTLGLGLHSNLPSDVEYALFHILAVLAETIYFKKRKETFLY